MQPIPLALCITDLDLGGAERQFAELAARIDRNRFAPVVYCLGPRPVPEAASCLPRIEQAGIDCHCLGARAMRHFPWVTGRLTALLRRQRPALFQSFLFHANLAGRLAARRAEVPHVVCSLRVAEHRQRWHLWLDRLTQAKVDRYVCVSQAVADFSRREAHLQTEKLVVIPNGVDADCHHRPTPADLTPFGIPPAAPVVVCVARLARQKGQAWLIRSAPQWLGKLPDCHLLLVGEGPDRASLERQVQRAGLQGRIHFAGFINDIPGILASVTALALPSLWEGMPNALLEAMAAGLPVVASRVEGVDELLGPLAERQTVPYGDDSALSARLESIVRDRELARSLGNQNRQRVQRHFTINATCLAYQRLWDALLKTEPPYRAPNGTCRDSAQWL